MRDKGIPCVVLKHKEGYVTHKIQYEEDNYIFNKFALTGNDSVMTNYINEHFKNEWYGERI